MVNKILEKTLTTSKPLPRDTREQKSTFIKEKYMKKSFIPQEKLISKAELSSVLKFHQTKDMFKKFLQSEFSAENIAFWEVVEELKQLTAEQDIELKVKEIYNTYCVPASETYLNLPDQITKDIDQRIHNNAERVKKNFYQKAQANISIYSGYLTKSRYFI